MVRATPAPRVANPLAIFFAGILLVMGLVALVAAIWIGGRLQNINVLVRNLGLASMCIGAVILLARSKVILILACLAGLLCLLATLYAALIVLMVMGARL